MTEVINRERLAEERERERDGEERMRGNNREIGGNRDYNRKRE